MTSTAKDDLLRYLTSGREALLWKLEGVSEYDLRRPLVPTGTNLLGLVKHVASVEAGYLGVVFDRPFSDPMPWIEDSAQDNADMWATADESRAWVVDLYRRVGTHSEVTLAALELDAPGEVPWWPPERRSVTLHQIVVHVIAETHRHAGHADLVRELIDGSVGLRQGSTNLPPVEAEWWHAYRDRLEQVARRVGRPDT